MAELGPPRGKLSRLISNVVKKKRNRIKKIKNNRFLLWRIIFVEKFQQYINTIPIPNSFFLNYSYFFRP